MLNKLGIFWTKYTEWQRFVYLRVVML